jgi:cell division initiation protein
MLARERGVSPPADEALMKITPLEIQQQKFAKTFRGISPEDVESFLQLVSSEFEGLVQENNELKALTDRQKDSIEDFKSREAMLKETMLTAQRVTEDMKVNAQKEADIILGRAELERERILDNAQERLTELLTDISELKREKAQLMAQMKGVLDTYYKLLEVEEEKDAGAKVENNLKVMPNPRQIKSAPAAVGPAAAPAPLSRQGG